MRALVTGAAGFVGGWLARALAARDVEVHGMRLAPDPDRGDSATGAVTAWHEGDLRDPAVLGAAVAASRPDMIFHLAGISSVREAERDPAATVAINVGATVRLLHEVARARDAGLADPTVLVVGSGEQYGRHDDAELPLPETAEQRPLSLYAATKAAQEVLALQAWRRHGVRVVCARSFNHTGAGQPSAFLIPALVERALALRARGSGELRLGNSSPVRDVSHVSDVVDAYILLAERGTPGEVYNVCRGEGTSVREIAAAVLRRVGISVPLTEDPALVRPVDVPTLVGDPTRLRARTGWAPRHSLDDCIDDLIHATTH
ncbi:MAG: GDP-mannose 4,6-dehydratase [Gemmatimonadaceae bacterium]